MNKPVKSTSLKELGYKITPTSGKDARGNEFVLKVTGPTPVYYIKQSKRSSRLIAVKDKESAVESTIEGLYNFKQENDDLVGKRATSTTGKSTKTPQAA